MFSENIVDISYQFPSKTTNFFFPPSEGDFKCNTTFNYTSTLDGNPIIKTYNNFYIDTLGKVSVSNRCKGLYLKILGDCIIDGKLSMTARGAKGQGTNIGINTNYGVFYNNNKNSLINNYNILPANIIPAVGASNNTNGTNRQTGRRRRWCR